MRLRIDVRGAAVVSAKLGESADAPPMRAVLAAIGVQLRRAFAQNFAAGGRPTWAPLAPSTEARKMALYLGGRIRGRKTGAVLVNRRHTQPLAPGALFPLVRTGALRDSVVRRGVRGNITRINAEAGTLEVGTSIFYGKYHQDGTSNPDGSPKMPARPFLTVTDAEWDEIANMVVEMFLGPQPSGLIGGE